MPNFNTQQRTAPYNSMDNTNMTCIFFSNKTITKFNNNFTSSKSFNVNSTQFII
jgi:hypothetical protein